MGCPRRSAASGASLWQGTVPFAERESHRCAQSAGEEAAALSGEHSRMLAGSVGTSLSSHRLVSSYQVQLKDQHEDHPRLRLLSIRDTSVLLRMFKIVG